MDMESYEEYKYIDLSDYDSPLVIPCSTHYDYMSNTKRIIKKLDSNHYQVLYTGNHIEEEFDGKSVKEHIINGLETDNIEFISVLEDQFNNEINNFENCGQRYMEINHFTLINVLPKSLINLQKSKIDEEQLSMFELPVEILSIIGKYALYNWEQDAKEWVDAIGSLPNYFED